MKNQFFLPFIFAFQILFSLVANAADSALVARPSQSGNASFISSKDPWKGHLRNSKEKERLPHNAFIASLENKDSFSFILLGDPQSYNRKSFKAILKLMTSWTLLNKEHLNVKALLCTGDLVENNDNHIMKNRSSWCGDISSEEQWQAVSEAFKVLDGELPYVLALGNHDYGYRSAENRNTNFSKYFYPERNSALRQILVSTGKNYFGKMTLENAAYEFEDKNWGKILVLVLEFAPSERAQKWANSILCNDKYKEHKVIVLTHSFLDGAGKIIAKELYKLSDAKWANSLWEEVIKSAPNVKMVICGHAGNFCSYKVEKNDEGKDVHMMMFNPQFHAGNGGDAWLRILEFMPDGKTVGVRTFSPLFAVSPNSADLAWRKGAKYEYKIVLHN